MSDGAVGVPVVALLAVVAVPAGRVVPALQADASAHAARQLVQVHVEAALPRVLVAIAHWNKKRRPGPGQFRWFTFSSVLYALAPASLTRARARRGGRGRANASLSANNECAS